MALVPLAIVGLGLALLLAFSQQTVREIILRYALDRVATKLPAALKIEKATWPEPGSITVEGISLRSGEETLAAAERLEFVVRLSPLLRRDLHIRSLKIAGIILDLPEIRAAFAPEGEKGSESKGGAFPFRPGAIATLPSAFIQEIALSGKRLRFTEGKEATGFRFEASADNRTGEVPELVVHELQMGDPGGVWQFEKMEVVARRGEPLRADAVVGIAQGNRLFLEVREEGAGAYRIALREGGEAPVAAPLLEGMVESGGRNETLAVRFTMNGRVPETERLLQYEPAAPYLKNAPVMGGIPFGVDGEWFAGDGRGELSLRVGANGWIDEAGARLRWKKDQIDLDSVTISIDDFLGTARLSVCKGEVAGECRIDLLGSNWLSPLLPSAEPPPAVRGRLLLETAGRIDSLSTTASLLLSEIGPAPAIRQLSVEARHDGAGGAIHTVVGAETDRIRIDFAATLDTSFSDFSIGPIRLFDLASPHPGPPAVGANPGTIRIDRPAGSARLAAVRLTGDYGRATVRGVVSRSGGNLRLGAVWSGPPAALLRTMEPAARDLLRQRWPDAPPFRIDGSLRFGEGETGWRASAQADFDLPGLSLLSPALPPDAGHRLAGEIALDAPSLNGERPVTGSLHVRPEGWIDSVAAFGFMMGEKYGIDSALVLLPGLRLRGEGTAGDSLRIACSYEIVTEAIRAFLPENPPVDSLVAAGDLRITGSPASPEARLSCSGHARGASFAAESFEGEAGLSDGSIVGEIRIGDRSLAGPIRLDHGSASWKGPSTPPYLPARIVVDADGPDLEFSFDSEWDLVGDTLLVRGSSLHLAVQNQTLKTTHPFDILFDTAARRIGIRGLDLAGTMGTIRAEGTAGAESADISLHAALEIPERPFDWFEGTLPDRVEIDATAKGRDQLVVAATAKGLDVGPRKGVEIRLDVNGSDADLSARLSAANRTGLLLAAHASLPLRVRFFPPGLVSADGPLRIDTDFERLPVPLSADRGETVGWAEATGRFSATGTASLPAFEGSASVGFPSLPSLADYQVLLAASSIDEGGLLMQLDVNRGGHSIAEASIQDPTRIRLIPFEVVRDTSGMVTMNLRTKELRLQDFNRWFPSGASAEGNVTVDLAAEGPVQNPDLRGRITAKKLNLKLSDQSRFRAGGEINLAGTLRKPHIRGEASIDNGILRVPDNPKNLLPATGRALLWEFPEYADTAGQEAAAEPFAPPSSRAPSSIDPDMEVNLSIPSGLWIRGQGLDVELSGDLSLTYRGGAPSITGELAADRGHFIFLGRTFRMESGTITFYGEDEINPALNINLTINVEGTLVRVSVGGTLLDPQLGFSSEPAMSEGDIMSFLLFGRPLEDLNNNQMDLVQSRAADIVTTFGSAQLEAKLAGQLGVDMVRIRDTKGDAKGSSLVLGKYISRKVLLEYERALESNLFFISLDYFLTRHFRLRTLYGQRDQSGMEMNWFNEY